MSSTLGQVKARVRALVDDPQGSWANDSFLNPLIQQIYDDCNSQLASTQSSWDISVIEVPGVQPGTPNLDANQQAGGELATLTDQPVRIDWKQAGANASYYQLITNYGVLPDIQPAQYMVGWEFREEIIWLTPCSIAVDLRVRGEFAPPPLTEDDDVLVSHPRIGYVVEYGTAALIAAVRGNEKWEATYGNKAIEGMDEIMGQLVRQGQGQTLRIGRTTRRRQQGKFGVFQS